jgi:gas vesicle protein
MKISSYNIVNNQYIYMENTNNLKIIAALAAGLIGGTAIGLLLAPAKGSDTRSKLLNGAKDIAENFKKKINNESVEAKA